MDDGNNEFERTYDLDDVFDYFELRGDVLMRRLKDLSKFPTVSSDPSKRNALLEMSTYLVDTLSKFDIQSNVVPMFLNAESTTDSFLPLILSQTKNDPTKSTVCFYCHYDVFSNELVENYDNNDEYGMYYFNWRYEGDSHEGIHVSKVPLVSIVNAVGAFRHYRIPLPVNVKIILDPLGTGEHDDTGKFLKKRGDPFFDNVDFACLSDGWWPPKNVPCPSFGCRGYCYFIVEIEGSSKDLHSGHYGGLINEPMSDLMYIMNQLVDSKGVIKIRGLTDAIVPTTKEDKKRLQNVAFNVRQFKEEIGAYELLGNEDKTTVLSKMWRLPSLSIHGIEGACSGVDKKYLIPRKVIGKFSINIVMNMTVSSTRQIVFDHLRRLWKNRKSRNKMRIQMTISKLPWVSPIEGNCLAAKKAAERAYGLESNLIQNSHRVRFANVLSKITKASVVNIGLGKYQSAFDVDEMVFEKHVVDCSKLFAGYLLELSHLEGNVSRIMANNECVEMGEFEGEEVQHNSVDSRITLAKGSLFVLNTLCVEIADRSEELKRLIDYGCEMYLNFLNVKQEPPEDNELEGEFQFEPSVRNEAVNSQQVLDGSLQKIFSKNVNSSRSTNVQSSLISDQVKMWTSKQWPSKRTLSSLSGTLDQMSSVKKSSKSLVVSENAFVKSVQPIVSSTVRHFSLLKRSLGQFKTVISSELSDRRPVQQNSSQLVQSRSLEQRKKNEEKRTRSASDSILEKPSSKVKYRFPGSTPFKKLEDQREQQLLVSTSSRNFPNYDAEHFVRVPVAQNVSLSPSPVRSLDDAGT